MTWEYYLLKVSKLTNKSPIRVPIVAEKYSLRYKEDTIA